jgi:HAD superfamily hydrolase (TIGR01509 family)
MKPDFKLLILDCDGTLITSEVLNNTAVSKALHSLGFTEYPVEACLDQFTGKSFKDICRDIELAENKDVDKEQFGKLITRFSIANLPKIKAVTNANKLLTQVSILKVVASNGHREFVLKYLEQAKLLKHFKTSDIFTHDQVSRPKPHPELFLYAAQMNGIDPKSAIVIEDSPTGIIAAKAAGMYAVGFVGSCLDLDKARHQLLSAGADIIIEDLLEILEFLQ